MWVAIFFEFFSNLKWADPLTKLNTNKSCYVKNIWLCMRFCLLRHNYINQFSLSKQGSCTSGCNYSQAKENV
jgi:hypothetical protein